MLINWCVHSPGYVNTPPNSQNSKRHKVQHNTQVPVGKHNNRQHASPNHEVATDVKQMPIRPIIMFQIKTTRVIGIVYWCWWVLLQLSIWNGIGLLMHKFRRSVRPQCWMCFMMMPWPWWRHQMEELSVLLAPFEGNPSVRRFSSQRPVTPSFDVFFTDFFTNLRRHGAHYDVTVMHVSVSAYWSLNLMFYASLNNLLII